MCPAVTFQVVLLVIKGFKIRSPPQKKPLPITWNDVGVGTKKICKCYVQCNIKLFTRQTKACAWFIDDSIMPNDDKNDYDNSKINSINCNNSSSSALNCLCTTTRNCI